MASRFNRKVIGILMESDLYLETPVMERKKLVQSVQAEYFN